MIITECKFCGARETECKFCGARETEAHTAMRDRCGKRYCRYKSYQSTQRVVPTDARQALLNQLTYDYKVLKQAGFKVPRDIK